MTSDDSLSIHPVQSTDERALTYIHELSVRVMFWLSSIGSLQQTGVSSRSELESILADEKEKAFLFCFGTQSIGCVFLRQLDPDDKKLAQLGLIHLHDHVALQNIDDAEENGTEASVKTWYLHTLMLEPTLQHQGLGMKFMRLIKYTFADDLDRGARIALDCFAGNSKLRDFYVDAGFTCIGIVPEEDYQIAVFVLKRVDEMSKFVLFRL